MTEIPRFVRERRRANGLTQRQLAELAGVGPRAVWDLERGKPTIRLDVVEAVLRVFGKRVGLADASRPVEPLHQADEAQGETDSSRLLRQLRRGGFAEETTDEAERADSIRHDP